MILQNLLRQADAANARLPASPQAKLPAALPTSSANSARTNKAETARSDISVLIAAFPFTEDAAIFFLGKDNQL